MLLKLTGAFTNDVIYVVAEKIEGFFRVTPQETQISTGYGYFIVKETPEDIIKLVRWNPQGVTND